MAIAFQNLPEQRQLLDAIAAGESGGYDVLYGGGRFTDYADHPRQAIPIGSGPNQGKTSSAAGRYQFLAPTWDEISKEIGLKDFSPDSQDAAAWHLAAKTYGNKTGRDLLADIKDGRTQDIAPALAPIWTSIPGGIEPNKATSGFVGRLGVEPVSIAASAPQMPAYSWSPGATAPAANVSPAPPSLGNGAVAAGVQSAAPIASMPPSYWSQMPAQAAINPSEIPPVVMRPKFAAIKYGKGFY
jgi:muramidase (phage lysozyme)